MTRPHISQTLKQLVVARAKGCFQLDGAKIIGLTAMGRATITLLQMNEPRRLLLRQTLILTGRYPL